MSVKTFICWYRSPAETPSDSVMARYDLLVGRGCPADRRDVLRRLNPRLRIVAYRNVLDCRLIEGVEGFGLIPTAGQPRSDAIDGSYNDIWRKHLDYLLKNRGGLRGASGDGRSTHAWGYQSPYDEASRDANRFFLNPLSGWKEYYGEICAAAVREGYDGVFVDNALAHIEWIFETCPDDYKVDFTDERWAAAMAQLLACTAVRLKREFPGAPVFANTCGDFVRTDSDDIEPTPFWRDARIDGAMDEFFVYHGGATARAPYSPESRWREQVRSILCCEKLGRAFLAQSNGAEEDHAARIYTLASFLIGAGERSMFNYNPGPAATYALVYRFPEWDIDLGRPLRQYDDIDSALAAGQSRVYARQFERGLVLVNPKDIAVENFQLPGAFRLLHLADGTFAHGGSAVWSPAGRHVTLNAHSAEILMKA